MIAVGVNRIGPLVAFATLLVVAPVADGAILSSTPGPAVVDGETLLSKPAELGSPDANGFWSLNSLSWGLAGEVTVRVSIDSTGIALLGYQAVFFTLRNTGAQDWPGFEIDLEGNGVFSLAAPIGIDRDSSTPVVSGDGKRLTFSGIDWPEGDQTNATFANLNFGLNLTPAGPDETIDLVFRPIPVPEPTSGLLLLAGSALIVRRRRQ